MKRAILISALLIMQGCTYAISSDVARQADKTIPFSRIEADPELYRGTLVILGGTIAKTSSKDHTTFVEVKYKDLDYWGKPYSRSRTNAGRFLVRYAGFLDPAVYSSGRDMTVAAVVEGIILQGIEDQAGFYPVLTAREIKLWPREPAAWSRPRYMDPLLNDPYAPPREY